MNLSLFSRDAAAAAPGDAELAHAADTRRPVRLGAAVLVLGFGGLVLWSAYAPLDEGVSASATVTIETRRHAIQHVSGGVVREVSVKEGQLVHAGDALMVLNDGAAKATNETIRQSYLGLRATEGRLLAEQTGRTRIEFHTDLVAAASDPLVSQHMAGQEQLFAVRLAARRADLAAAQEAIAGLQAQVTGNTEMLANRRAQLRLLTEQLAGISRLAEEGFAPRNQLLQMQQSQAELGASIADLEATRQRALRSISETRQRSIQRDEEYRKEVSTQLADVRREVQAGREKLNASTDELARTVLRTPVDGQVVGLAVTAVGGVVTPGQKLMDVVPAGGALLLEAHIPPHIVDKVHVGDPAEVRFSAFAHSPNLVLSGRLRSISGDALTDNTAAGPMSYYLARVEVTAQGLKALGSHVMQPGMPAEVLIKTGERSLLTYILHPLSKRIAGALTEE